MKSLKKGVLETSFTCAWRISPLALVYSMDGWMGRWEAEYINRHGLDKLDTSPLGSGGVC